MQVLWLDPYHSGSHAAVAQGYAAHSQHTVTLVTLPIPGGWRWRMRGAALTMARLVREQHPPPDVIVTTDMLDVATFRALTRDVLPPTVPVAVYFHENQLTYPLPAGRSRDLSYAWLNLTSALAADAVLFNSAFHQRSLLAALPDLLRRQHDYHELPAIDTIAAKSLVLPPGIALAEITQTAAPPPDDDTRPVILWNSRWEYDKQPEVFFAALEELAAQGIAFRLIVAGEHIDPAAEAFGAARARWQAHTLHWGYAPNRAQYLQLLRRADIVVSTAIQEFFGISVVEALAAGCIPVLPHRLTYPDLLPPDTHAACLYADDSQLAATLAAVIAQRATLASYDWRAVAAAYDWQHLAPRYDAVLAGLGGYIPHATTSR